MTLAEFPHASDRNLVDGGDNLHAILCLCNRVDAVRHEVGQDGLDRHVLEDSAEFDPVADSHFTHVLVEVVAYSEQLLPLLGAVGSLGVDECRGAEPDHISTSLGELLHQVEKAFFR